jgi:serine/threonine-protein kinase
MAADESSPDEPRTVFQPGEPVEPSPPAPPVVEQPSPPPPDDDPTGFDPQRTMPPPAMRAADGRIQVGDVLNHIFEVKRFLARGGMGEVFEGINVSSDERVAIKVMLPALAADPSVQAMFRKEARTLTRLNHAALVQYRVLAQEPQLGVLYIVTEFIAGSNLSHVLSTIRATPAELRALTRRLADGLRVAHHLGAIHRDISPDNVLLEDGRLDRAKVIDFGIAKDLDPSSKTIVGDGFAGKLNYVAPEQLGDFGREVGPWSDVYSLGLVILAVAQGRDVDMGATFVDAVDRRRSGPDLSAAPPEIRPVLERMLMADPAQRLRSMDEVIAALDSPVIAEPVDPPVNTAKKPARAEKPPKSAATETASGSSTMRWVAIGGAMALIIAAGGGYMLLGGEDSKAPVAETATAAPGRSPVESARAAIQAALPGIQCSWLDISRIEDASGGGVSVAITGVAKDPAAAQGAVSRALANGGVQASQIGFDEVLPVENQACVALDAFNKIRSRTSESLSVQQHKFELSRLPDGTMGTNAIINLDIGPAGSGVAVYGILPNGAMESVAADRTEFEALAKQYPDNFVSTTGTGYRAILGTTHEGLSGVVLLRGREPFDQKLLSLAPAARGADWANTFASEAAAGGWTAQIVWYRAVDEVPG